jgi:hypothetical protein
MKLIESKTLATAAASIEFTSIPQDGTDLLILTSLRSTAASGASPATIRFNGSSSNFSRRRLLGSGSGSPTSDTAADGSFAGYQTDTSNTFDSTACYIPNYTGSTNKSFSSDHVTEANQTTAYQSLFAGLWANTAPITSLSVHPDPSHNFAIGTTISLYKITKGSDGIVTTSP